MIDSLVLLFILVAAIACVPFVLRHQRAGTASGMRVTARTALAKGVVVAVVAVDDRRLVVGGSERGVHLLAELEGPGASGHEDGRPPPSATTPSDTTTTSITGFGGTDATGPRPSEPARQPSIEGGDDLTAVLATAEARAGGELSGPGIGLVDRLRAMTVRTPAAGRPIRAQQDR